MATKKSDADPVAGSGSPQEIIEERRKAKTDAVNQEGVPAPEPYDVNNPTEATEKRP